MKRTTMIGFAIGTAVVLLLTAPAVADCEACGPGAHWVDACAAGQDTIPWHGAVVGIDLDLDCEADTSLILRVCGGVPQIINRLAPSDDSANFPGTRPVDFHNDVIDTEITDLCMNNGGVTLIAGMGNGGIIFNSFGAIAEQLADNTLADSFFDVFFEMDLGDGTLLYNQTPLRMATLPAPDGGINCVPPGTEYFHPVACTPLFNDPNPGMGVPVANLVMAEHYVGTEYEVDDPPTGACCPYPDTGVCLILTEELCDQMGATYYGHGSTCNPNPCPPGSQIPAVSEWGILVMAVLVLGAGTMIFVRRRRLA